MTEARIYRPARNVMQSGQGKTHFWILEFAPASARRIEPLMGWTSSADMNQQVRLRFETRDQAVAFAERNGLSFRVEEGQERKTQYKNYADKFAWDRVA